MKKLTILLTPWLVLALLYATTETTCFASEDNTIRVDYATDLHSWVDLADIDLTQAKYNPDTGKQEIHLEVEVPEGANAGFFRAANCEMTFHYLNIPFDNFSIDSGIIVQALPYCGAGLIIGLLVLIIGAIIVYLLIKTCKRYLP